jgi:hypothetical protein
MSLAKPRTACRQGNAPVDAAAVAPPGHPHGAAFEGTRSHGAFLSEA